MIIFDLNCTHGHRFEGWFASAEEFDRQRDAALVACPVCDDVHVARLPSAQVRVPRAAARDNAPRAARRRGRDAPGARRSDESHAGDPREAARSGPRHRERRPPLPEEARKIHYNEVAARPIRGQASRDEAQALSDEGIDFASLPPFLTNDTH